MAPHPLGRRKEDGEHQEARDAGGPERGGEPQGKRPEHGDRQGKQHQDERHHPGECLGIDQKRRRDPVQAGQEIAETEAPAEPQAGTERTAPRRHLGIDAVEQPDQDREGDDEDRRQIERRHGKRRNGAEHDRKQRPPPAPQSHHFKC